MNNSHPNTPGTANRPPKKFLTGAISLMVFFILGGIWAITSLVNYEHQRDINTWQTTLNIMADNRAARIQQWSASQFNSLNELAENSSLQLYTLELSKRANRPDSEPAQLSYLRNLIRAAAVRYGFQDKTVTAPIPANISRPAYAGLALIAADGKVITSTSGMPAPDDAMRQSIATVIRNGKPMTSGIFMAAVRPQSYANNQTAMIAFLQPVFALQMPGRTKGAVAVLLAVKNAANSLFPILNSNAATTKTDEAILVRRHGNLVTYVSPLADGTPPLKRELALDDNLTAAYAINHPGSFTQLPDYTGNEVLATSRAMPGHSWILVQKITAAEALSESHRHQRFLYITLLLALTLTAALLLAAWFYGSSVREQKITARLSRKSSQLTAQTHLLNTISDNIHDFIFLVAANDRLIFANRVLATALGSQSADIKNKTLVSIFGPAPVKQLQPLLQESRQSKKTVFRELAMEINGSRSQFHISCITIDYDRDRTAPNPAAADNTAVLVSMHDVTLLREAQEKKNHLLDQIVKALMQAIDRHDPYSTNHSANTARIALAIGRAMKLDPVSLSALGTAANLCNIGKLSISRTLLAKTEPLTTAEEKELRRETDFAKDILRDIDFEGPILATILQKNEFLDGSGYPAGLTDTEIIPPARILAAANAFVAMISPRAYRNKLTVREALNEILTVSDSKYDRQVIAALFHVADNEIDWTTW